MVQTGFIYTEARIIQPVYEQSSNPTARWRRQKERQISNTTTLHEHKTFWCIFFAATTTGTWNVILGPFIRGKIRRVLHKTCLKLDANFPYKQHISSEIRRGLAKTRLIFARINGPNVTLYGGQANELGWGHLNFSSTKIPLYSLTIW